MANNFLKSPVDQALDETQSQGMSLPQFASTDTRQPADVDPTNVPYQADFNAAAQRYGVPVNVLMGLAEQESRFNPTALGQQTKYGRAKGVMQYIDSTAAGIGINPYNPQQSIDAAAKQLKERLDKGYSMEEAVSAHFAGDDRKQWGPKTAAYGREVLDRAQRFLDGGKASVSHSTPQQEAEAQVNADYPAAQSAMENVDQNRIKQSAMLEALNTEEPDRYRPLTPQEIQQLDIQKGATTVNPTADTTATPLTQITPDAITPEVAGQQPKEEPKGNEEGNFFTNRLNSLNIGLNTAARDLSEAVGMIPYVGKPIVDAMDRADRYISGKGTQQLLEDSDRESLARMTPAAVAGRKKSFVIEPGDDLGDGKKATNWSFGPAWSDPETYMSGIVESLPEMALTMGGAGVLAKGAYTGMIAKGATKAEAAKRAATVATVAGGFLEGSLGGAQASRTTRDEINKMTPDQLKDSDAMTALMAPGADGKRKTFEQARSALADNAATKAFLIAGVGTGIFGGMGDRAMVKVITGGSSRLRSAVTGMIGEGLFEEAPQSAAQQLAQNYVKQDADPKQRLMQGVANQVVAGGVTGGIMGAGMGFAAPHVANSDTPPADQQQSGDPAGQPPADTSGQPVPVDQPVVVPTGPIGRAMGGSEATPAGAVNDWLGKAGDKTTINPKDDPETTMHVTIESYLPNGDVAVRDEDGTKYQLSPDDLDLTGEHRESAESSRKDAEQAAKQAEKPAKKAADKPKDELPRQQVGQDPESWTNSNAQNARDQADRMKVTGKIEELFAQGKTAAQVRTEMSDDLKSIPQDERDGFVVNVRATLGIPSQATVEGKAEFSQWQADRQKRISGTGKPAVRTEDRPQPKTIDQMNEDELRTRLKYLATQAKQNGWDARLTNERKKVEAAINAKTAPAKEAPADDVAGDDGLTTAQRQRLAEIVKKEVRTDAEKKEATDLIATSNGYIERQAATHAVSDKGMTIVHGSGNPALTADDIQIVRTEGQKQGKRGRSYGGFYGTREADADQAKTYAEMKDGTPTVYDVKIKPGTKVLTKDGDITRLEESYIKDLVSQGYGVVVGKDPRGKTEYAVIDKAAIETVAPRTSEATSGKTNSVNVGEAGTTAPVAVEGDNAPAVSADVEGAANASQPADAGRAVAGVAEADAVVPATADAKRPLTDAQGNAKWFTTAERAQEYIEKKKAITTHEVVPVRGNRFEIRPIENGTLTNEGTTVNTPAAEQSPVKIDGQTTETAGTSKKTTSAAGPHAARTRKIVGADVGDIITPSEEIGYTSADTAYQIDRIEKNGTLHLTNQATGSGTQLTKGELERGVARTARWTKTEKLAEVKGAKIDKNWSAFTPDSGTLNIPRADMPQIAAEHRGAMVNFLTARGITHTEETVPATSLKPTQREFSPAKVAQAAKFEGGDRSILVSNDGHILDGHHQWLAKRDAGQDVKVIKLDAPISELLQKMQEFPSAGMTKDAVSQAPKAVRTSELLNGKEGDTVRVTQSGGESQSGQVLRIDKIAPNGDVSFTDPRSNFKGSITAKTLEKDVRDGAVFTPLETKSETNAAKSATKAPETATAVQTPTERKAAEQYANERVISQDEVNARGDGTTSPWLFADGRIISSNGDHISLSDQFGYDGYRDMSLGMGAVRAQFNKAKAGEADPSYVSLQLFDDQKLTAAQYDAVASFVNATGAEITLGVDRSGRNTQNVAKEPVSLADLRSQHTDAAPAAAYGANNKLVSADRAAELRKKLKAKFSQLNSGIDPEILAIGTELAVFHIEAGVRKFSAFAKAMAADLDLPLPRLRPYLRSWYNGARDMMEDSNISIDGMDSADTVRAELAALQDEPQDTISVKFGGNNTANYNLPRPAHEMTREEISTATGQSGALIEREHSTLVKQAYAEGKNVPAKVLYENINMVRPDLSENQQDQASDAMLDEYRATGSYEKAVGVLKNYGKAPTKTTSGSMDDMVNSFDSEVKNVSGTRNGVEPDRGNAGNTVTGNENPVSDGSGRTDGGAQPAGRRAQSERSAGQRDQRLSDDGTATDGARSDKRIHQPDGQFNVEGGTAGSVERARSRGNSEPRPNVDAIRAAAVARNADAPGASDLSSRLKAQKAARNVPTVFGDRASIDAALPLLLPEQRGDVEKVEARHATANGMLLTNGTGTGKTASGMGVAKRFHNAGKKNIIVVVPTDKIAADWVKFAGMMDMPLLQLGGVADNGGTSPVVTTYANFAMNDALAQRDWDLVIPDESHYLSSNAAGEDTNALKKFRALTGHPDGFMTYMQSKHAAQYDELTQASHLVDELRSATNLARQKDAPAAKENYDRLLAAWTAKTKAARAEWEQRWTAQADIPKVVFLSATPFAYVKSTDYAEGFLFHHTSPAERYSNNEQARGSGYNTTDAREQFYVQHFGFRMRYNRLTTPDAAVNTELMEQNFNQWLKDTGALSGRTLDVPHDYDRRFALVDDAAGKRLDDALKYLNEGEGGLYRKVYDAVMKTFDFQKRMFLLESMKARAAVGMINEHLALGRKVVVFHDYNKGGGFSPFAEAMAEISKSQPELRALAREVLSKPMFKIDFSGLESSLATLTAAYPDALLFNGTVPKKKRRENADLFNDDKSGKNLIIAQSDAAREGVSLHDTTGKHQRVEINLGMPTKPVAATQIEGRIYRTGQASDAIFRYLTTGTSWEAQAFASKIAERASTAENLALGTDARGLKQAFIDAYSAAEPMVAGADDGKGGKAYDRSMSASNAISPFDKAKTYYFAQQKNTKRRGDREGVDYFATPEPVGFKMVDWAAIKDGEKVLEPSAGHGAIARFFPAQSDVTMVEPSYDLSNRAALANGQARIVNSKFEDLSLSNKYDAIVMNPPYGSGGKTAVEHMEKAARHLREGGRMVALIPRGGQVEKRLEAFAEVAEKNGLHLVAKVAMPSSTFERAGTSVNTQVLVYEKHSDGSEIQPQNIDLSNAENVTELFDRIENVDIQPRQATTMDEALRNVSQDAPRFLQEPDPFVTDFMTELTANDQLFRYPRVPGTYSLQGIFDQIDPDVKVVGETGRVDERDESGADERFMLTTGKGRDFYVYQTPDQVWIDVSRLEKGDGGAAIYAAVADYALNTKRKFIGDPAGLSDDALRRRTDAMLSSALKHSTTEHLEPHERQITGDPELGVPPLNWKDGDDLGNIRSLIDVSTASLAHYVPEISRARYDFNTGTFRTGEGKPLTDATLGEWSASKGRIRAAGAGRATLKRVILLNSLAREPSGSRSRLLERVLSQPSQLVTPALTGILYRPALKPGVLNRVSTAMRDLVSRRDSLPMATYVNQENRLLKQLIGAPRTGAAEILADMKVQAEQGGINADTLAFGQWMLEKYPQVANGLALDFVPGSDNAPLGRYYPAQRLVEIFKDYRNDNGRTVSSTEVDTIVHEILHHSERMLPPRVQDAVAQEWMSAREAAMKDATADRAAMLDDLMLATTTGDPEAVSRTSIAVATGQITKADYALANPSEYWAVNAARILQGRQADSGSWVGIARRIMKSIIGRLRSMFGRSVSPLETALDSLLAGKGVEQNASQIRNLISYDLSPRPVMADSMDADMPRFKSGLTPNPEIPDTAQYDARTRSWWGSTAQWTSDRMTTHLPKLLATVPMRPLVMELGRKMPQAGEYMRLKQSMDAMRSKWHAKTDRVAQEWLKYRTGRKAENKVLMDIMHESTRAQVDPSEPFQAFMNANELDRLYNTTVGTDQHNELVRKDKLDKQRAKDYADLEERFKTLSPEGKEMYKTVRDTYTQMADAYEQVLMDNMEKAINVRIKKADRDFKKEVEAIRDAGLEGADRDAALEKAAKTLKVAKTKVAWNRKARMTQLRQQFEMNRLGGPYFPLARFGNLFVTVRDKASGKVESFSRFEDAGSQRKFAELMKAKPEFAVEVGALDDTEATRKAVDPNFVADVEDILADLPNADKIKDEVWQRYLETLPDFSVRKNRIHRKGREGFDADALRAFGSNMFHGSHQLARLAHAFDMTEAIDAAREEARKTNDPVRDTLVVNEIAKRNDFVMNPTGGPIAQGITQAAFIYALAASPKAAIANLFQTVIMGVPMLAAYHGGARGFVRATFELNKALADFTRGKGYAERAKSLSSDEKKAMASGYDIGIIDRTQSHDLAGVGETGVEYSPRRARFMAAIAWGFHNGERLNREVTYLAAYRMARAKGRGHEQSMIDAGNLTYKTHFDYQNTSRPRMMHTDLMKAVLVFRNFQVNMLYRLFRDVHQTVNGESKEIRREALAQLAGTTGMMMLNAGLTGTWLFGIAMLLAKPFLDDGDDPEEELKKGMVNTLGPAMAGIVLDGVPGYITGTSLSESIGMPDLWFRSPNRQLEGKEEFQYWQNQLLGAAPSMLENVVRGYTMVTKGQTYKGIETMMPKAIKDPMKAYRYATEGLKNVKGDTIVDNVSAADVFKQAIGFTPARIAEQYDTNNANYNKQQAIMGQRTQLLTDFKEAMKAGDEKQTDKVRARIIAFNEKYPEQGLKAKNLQQSMKADARNRAKATNGMLYNRKLKGRILDEQSPPIYE